jgi:hypothetical protein
LLPLPSAAASQAASLTGGYRGGSYW